MDRVPFEVILRHAASEASRYFANRIEEERANGRVAVLVRNLMDSLFFLPCTREGYPDYYQYKSLHIPDISLAMPMQMYEDDVDISKTPFSDMTMTVEEITVIVDKPLLSHMYYESWDAKPIIFMWEGTCTNRERIPVEKLNVKELMILAQNAIQKREGLIIDEAFRNKIYK